MCCNDCAKRLNVCAKCLTSGDKVNIEPPERTAEEELKHKVEMENMIKSLPERKRRTFLRYMNKGKQVDADAENEGEDGKKIAISIFSLIQYSIFIKNIYILFH